MFSEKYFPLHSMTKGLARIHLRRVHRTPRAHYLNSVPGTPFPSLAPKGAGKPK